MDDFEANFKRLIELVQLVAFDKIGQALAVLGGWTVFLIPTLGGLVVGLLMHWFVGEERHHGVAGIIEAVALAGGRFRCRSVPTQVLCSVNSCNSLTTGSEGR